MDHPGSPTFWACLFARRLRSWRSRVVCKWFLLAHRVRCPSGLHVVRRTFNSYKPTNRAKEMNKDLRTLLINLCQTISQNCLAVPFMGPFLLEKVKGHQKKTPQSRQEYLDAQDKSVRPLVPKARCMHMHVDQARFTQAFIFSCCCRCIHTSSNTFSSHIRHNIYQLRMHDVHETDCENLS